MIADDNGRLARRQRIASDNNIRLIRLSEYALNMPPYRLRDQRRRIINSSGRNQRERQQQRQQSVCDDQAEQPRQEMQGGAEKVAEALKRRRE